MLKCWSSSLLVFFTQTPTCLVTALHSGLFPAFPVVLETFSAFKLCGSCCKLATKCSKMDPEPWVEPPAATLKSLSCPPQWGCRSSGKKESAAEHQQLPLVGKSCSVKKLISGIWSKPREAKTTLTSGDPSFTSQRFILLRTSSSGKNSWFIHTVTECCRQCEENLNLW